MNEARLEATDHLQVNQYTQFGRRSRALFREIMLAVCEGLVEEKKVNTARSVGMRLCAKFLATFSRHASRRLYPMAPFADSVAR